MGESFKIISMHFMKISLQRVIPSAAAEAFSPSMMIEKPIRMAMTMTCSMFASERGTIKLEGKMLTRVSMALVAAAP